MSRSFGSVVRHADRRHVAGRGGRRHPQSRCFRPAIRYSASTRRCRPPQAASATRASRPATPTPTASTTSSCMQFTQARAQNGAGTIWLFSGATVQLDAQRQRRRRRWHARQRGHRQLHRPHERPRQLRERSAAGRRRSAGPTCASPTVGPPDGVNEILIGAGGVDVGGTPGHRPRLRPRRQDAGDPQEDRHARRRPRADRHRIAENPLPATATAANPISGGFGRTVTNPRGLPPCDGQLRHRRRARHRRRSPPACASATSTAGRRRHHRRREHVPRERARRPIPLALRGQRGHRDLRRRRAARTSTAARTSPAPTRRRSSRAPLDDDHQEHRRADRRSVLGTAGHIVENFGHSQIPVGDLGTCNAAGPGRHPRRALPAGHAHERARWQAGLRHLHAPLGMPAVQPRSAYFESGASILFDGATGAILYIYNHPEPQRQRAVRLQHRPAVRRSETSATRACRTSSCRRCRTCRTSRGRARRTCSAGTSRRT